MEQKTYVIGTKRTGVKVVVKIGKAVDPKKRLKELQTGHPEVLKIFTTFPNEGQTAEAALHARYKQYQTRGSGEWFALPRNEFRVLLKGEFEAAHKFPCEVCGAANPKDGLLYVNYEEVWSAVRANDRWNGGGSSCNGWGCLPEDARWRSACFACAPEECYYDIPLTDVLNPAKLLHWTSHLLSKGWLQATDWQLVLDRAVSD